MNRTTAIQRLTVLRKVEWGYWPMRCAVCKQTKETGHAASCKLAALIADEEETAQAVRDQRELRRKGGEPGAGGVIDEG